MPARNLSMLLNSWPPAWKSQNWSIGHSDVAGRISFIVSMGGMAGPGLVSVLNPNAPPCLRSSSQYCGGMYSYGPFIFTPEGPVIVLLSSEAEETTVFCHR